MKSFHLLSNNELIELCLSGEKHAWEELIKRHSRLIYSITLKYNLALEDRDDVFQSVCFVLRTLGFLIAITIPKNPNQILLPTTYDLQSLPTAFSYCALAISQSANAWR